MPQEQPIKVTSRNILDVITTAVEAAGFPGKNTELIIKAAQAKRLMTPAEKFTTQEFVMGYRAFIVYALKRWSLRWLETWRKSDLVKMWLCPGGEFEAQDVIGICVKEAERVLAGRKASAVASTRAEVPGWLEG